MYKQDLALNKLQWLICHKTKPNNTFCFVSVSMHFLINSSPFDDNTLLVAMMGQPVISC